jgi:hypothetical protein
MYYCMALQGSALLSTPLALSTPTHPDQSNKIALLQMCRIPSRLPSRASTRRALPNVYLLQHEDSLAVPMVRACAEMQRQRLLVNSVSR